ncbi:MAG TPA: hypothetical protein VFW78_10070 [Bacteroidia bacterium]|nr:hypothetical protein [Bacteroidia bacterium]
MKRVVSSSIVTLLILVTSAVVFMYIRNYNQELGNPYAAIPSDAVFYITTNPIENGIDQLLVPNAWGVLAQAPVFSDLKKQLEGAKNILHKKSELGGLFESGKLILSAHITGAGTFDFLYLKLLDGGTIDLSSAFSEIQKGDANINRREYDGNTIYDITYPNGTSFTWAVVKSVFVGSFTSFLVEDALRQQKVGKPAVWVTDKKHELSEGIQLCINFNNIPSFISLFTEAKAFNGFSAIRNFAGWFSSDMSASKSRLKFNGILSTGDSSKFIYCLKGQQPVRPELPALFPAKTAAAIWFGFSDLKLYSQRLKRFHALQGSTAYSDLLAELNKKFKTDLLQQMTSWVTGEYGLVVTEPSSSNYENNIYAVFKASKPALAKQKLAALSSLVDEKLGEKTQKELYQGCTIGLIRLTDVIPAIYGVHFKRLSRMYYTIIDNQVVFANQAAALRSYIDEVKSGHTLADIFKNANNDKKQNFFLLIKPEASIPVFKSVASAGWRSKADKYRDQFAAASYISFSVMANGENFSAESVIDFGSNLKPTARLMYSIETDTIVEMAPLLINDPVTGEGRLIFQDDAGVLYLSDMDGNILWRTALDSRIMGSIHPIDFFRNGKVQFLFNTPGYLYLIDMNGNPVGNYPIRLPATATNPMTLALKDIGGEQVIYIACENKRIYAYLPSGRPLPGWNFLSSTGTVSLPVKAFESGNKYYLLISDREGAVTVTNRLGDVSVSLSQGFIPGENSTIYTDSTGSDEVLIVTSDADGNIVKVMRDGLVTILPVHAAGPGHGFYYTDINGDGKKDYLFAGGKELVAYDQSMAVIYRKEFDADITGEIQQANLPDGSTGYGITSAAGNKTWIYHLDGRLYDGFPVRGSGKFSIGDINADGRHNLMIGSRTGAVYIYSLD